MADINSNINVNIETGGALASIRQLQAQISAFQSALAKGSAASAKAAQNLQRDLVNNINATGKFSASMTTVASSAENFTRALESNKLSLGQYFRYAGASTTTFGKLFRSEFDTINKVVRERVKTIQTQFVKMGRDSNGALQAIKIRPLALDLKDYGTQAQMAAQRQAVFNQLVKQGSTQLLNFGKNTQWAGRQLMVGFTIPLTIMGATAVKEFEKIEKQAIRFKRVYGDAFSTTAETDEALKNIRALANEFTKYGIEVEKTMELAADAAQMGLKNADLMAQVTEATRLAVLGEVEQQEALETSISLTNAFGIAAEDLAQKINFLNAVENETVTAISDLTTAIPKAGPVIKQLGGDVEDLAFFLTAMKEGGINASEGANALKSGLAKIINPTEKASIMLQGLGINIRGIVDANAGDIKSTVLELADALDSLDPLNRARAIEELFGRFQFARISTLFQNIVREGSQAERVLKLSRASAEELAILSERELKRVEDSPLFKFQKTIERLQASLAPLGEEFLKAITPIVEFATQFLENFNNMSDGAKRFAVIATTVIAGIGPIALMTFGLLANGVANLIKLFAGMGRMFTGFGQKTTDLGLQTQYLTNEQLESQAAAISMGQAHGQLTQVLTSEAAAVGALAAAYNTMTAAQRRAAAMQGIPLPGVPAGPKPKKYKSGVISVPGPKGAGDIVPAMLAPGEAVIPARQSQKYAGLISGMINDNIPGFRFGLNPFANMLGRSRVAVRTNEASVRAMLSQGKDARYSSAFVTGKGADYLSVSGRPNPSQARIRAEMEEKIFGLGPNTPASARPTYGYAKTSPIQAFINRIFGLKGKRYNAVTARHQIGDKDPRSFWTNPKTGKYEPNPKYQTDTLGRYGDIDLITKRQVGSRSRAAVTDALMDYNRNPYKSKFSLTPVPMRGAKGNFDSARFDRLSNPFGSYKADPVNNPNLYVSNPKPPYVETYTPGGFGLNEVSKIRVVTRAQARELQKLVDQAGLRIRVTPQNAPGIVKLFSNIFGTRFSEGLESQSYQNYGKTLKGLQKHLRGAPNAISSAFTSAEYNYGSFAAEDSIMKKAITEEVRRANPGISKDRLEKTVNNYLGYDRAHITKSQRMIPFGGQQVPVKVWELSNLRMEHRAVNQALESFSTMGSPRGSWMSQNAGLFKRMSGLTPASFEKEMANLLAGNHPTSKNGYKLLRAMAQASNKPYGLALSKLLDFRLNDKSAGSYFNALKAGKLQFGGTAAQATSINAKAAAQQKTRIANYEKKLVPTTGVTSSSTGKPKPSSVKRIGGKPSDTRMIAVSPNETFIDKKTTNALKSGKLGRVPGIGPMAMFANGILGKADIPGQGPIGGPANPFSKMANQSPQSVSVSNPQDIAKESVKADQKALRSGRFTGAISKVTGAATAAATRAGAAIAKPIAIRLGNIAGNDIVDSKGNVVNTGNNATKGFLGAKSINTPGSFVQSGKNFYQVGENGKMVRVSNAVGSEGIRQQQQPKAPKPAGRAAGGIGMVAGMAAMGYSATGGPGADIAAMAAMPLMMLPMLGPMLTNPIFLAVAALGGITVAAFALAAQFKKTVKESYDLTMATGASAEALESFAEFGGNVTAGQIMDRRRQEGSDVFQIVAGKTGFGDAFLQTEAGQKTLESFGKNLEVSGRAGAVAGLQNQMLGAVASGALDAGQARDIVAAIGKQINDYELSIDINANLLNILGPNGENLAKDPLLLRTKVVTDARDRLSIENIFGGDLQNLGKFGTRLMGPEGFIRGLFGEDYITPYKSEEELGFWEKTFGSIGLNEAVQDSPLMFWTQQDQIDLSAAEIGAFVGRSALALQLQQEMVDSLQLEYETRIANAKAANDSEEATRLEAEYLEKRNSLMLENKEIVNQIVSTFGQIPNQGQILDTFSEQIKSIYKDDPVMSKVVDGVIGTIEKLPDEQELVLKASLLTGDISPIALENMFSNMTHEASVQVIAKMGVAGAVDVSTLASLFGDKTTEIAGPLELVGGKPVQSSITQKISDAIISKVLGMGPAAADAYLKAFDPVVQVLSSQGGEMLQSGLKFYFENPDVLSSVNESIELFKEEVGEEEVTLDVIQNVYGQDAVDAVKRNQDYFNTLDKDNKIIYTTVLEVLGNIDPVAFQAMAINAAMAGGMAADRFKELAGGNTYEGLRQATQRYGPGAISSITGGQSLDDLASQALNDSIAQQYTDMFKLPGSGGGEETDSTGSQSNPLLDILTALKRLRNAAIDTSGSFDDLKSRLKKLMAEGTNTTKFFRGVDQKLLLSGYNSEFIDAVMSMDEETRKSFISINNGVVKVTSAGKALSKAFSEITLGDFQFSLVQGLADTNKQISALNTLVGAGMSSSDAMDIVSDSTLAYAIATATTSEEVEELIRNFKNLRDAQDTLANSTEEGMERSISDALGKVAEFFSAQEAAVNLAFEANTEPLTNATDGAITLAQREIEGLAYVLDDLDYALSEIKDREDEINEKYDKRVESLEEISQINSDIIEQNKGKLGIAQALASGDIAAAARAVQDYRADEALRQKEKARAVLENAREAELSNITAANGKTRLELEKEIADIQKQIAAVEESRLEPAQKLLREYEQQRDIALEAIGDNGYLGKTKAEWAAVENGIRLAKVEGIAYADSIKAALLLIPQLRDAYNGVTPKSEGSEDDGLTQEQRDAIAKIKSNRTAVRNSDGTTAADKVMMEENIRLIKMLDAAGISRSLFMSGGGIVPKYYAAGGYARGTDSIPAMLTPGEFVVRKYAVDKFGADRLKAINSGAYNGGSMYNSYELNVNVKSDANPDQIARAVMTQIKQIDSQRVRSNRF